MATILIVDDMPMIHRLLCIMLSRNNHKVITALNGKEALAKLKETPVDLMITDINMPVMDGLTLMEKIQSDDRHKKLPIIVMTASITDHLKLLSNGLRTHPILTQPITTRELNDAVTHCLQVPAFAD
ncbi:MAG: response regulator [Anaerolineae bacterium]|jgi:CheY-like chemotaxis protein|nr:response regulator [Anaerolineae bacterium]